MIAVEKRECTGRTYEEDDEELTSSPYVPKQFTLRLECDVSVVEAAIIGVDLSSIAFRSAMIESFSLKSVGRLDDASQNLCNTLWYNESSKLLFVAYERTVDAEDVSAWLTAVMALNPKVVLGLGSMSISQYFGEREAEYILRKIETSSALSSVWTRFTGSLNVRNLEPGNVVTGLSAGLVTYCEARGIPSIVFLTITSASISLGSLRVLEKVYPILQLFAGELRKPTNKEYSDALKTNTFLSTTENMYC